MNSLDETWDITTERLRLGQNTGFKIKETQTGEQDWSLRYDSKEELDDAFFKTVSQVELLDILMFVGEARFLPDSGAPERCFTQVGSALPTNIRLSWKGLPWTNALAYYEKA